MDKWKFVQVLNLCVVEQSPPLNSSNTSTMTTPTIKAALVATRNTPAVLKINFCPFQALNLGHKLSYANNIIETQFC